MNAFEVRQAWCLLQVKLCDPCLSALKWSVYHVRHYTSALLFFTLFTLLPVCLSLTSEPIAFGRSLISAAEKYVTTTRWAQIMRDV